MVFRKYFSGRIIKLAAYLCLFLLSFFPAFAHEEGPSHSHKDSCKLDIIKFCQSIPKGQVLSCLKKNEDSLSEECQVLFGEIRDIAKQRLEACREDRNKFCSDRRTTVIRCLRENENLLSEKCRTILDVNQK